MSPKGTLQTDLDKVAILTCLRTASGRPPKHAKSGRKDIIISTWRAKSQPELTMGKRRRVDDATIIKSILCRNSCLWGPHCTKFSASGWWRSGHIGPSHIHMFSCNVTAKMKILGPWRTRHDQYIQFKRHHFAGNLFPLSDCLPSRSSRAGVSSLPPGSCAARLWERQQRLIMTTTRNCSFLPSFQLTNCF